MSLALKRMWLYARVLLIVLVLAAEAAVLVSNRDTTVSFWFFRITRPDEPVRLVWVLVYTFAAAGITALALRSGWRVWRDSRELARLEAERVDRMVKDRLAEERRAQAAPGEGAGANGHKPAEAGP